MKNLFLTTLCIIALGSFVKAQFNFTQYVAGIGNCTLPSNYVQGGVAIDTNKNKWFGTDMGLAKFDGTNWTVFTTSDGLPDNSILCVAVDKYNNIWVGTNGSGVAKYNGTAWTTYTATDGLCDNAIHYISGDIDGSVWFGSWGSGVSKLNGTTWTTYTSQLPVDGINPASINYIKIDASGTKWFGTSMGISKYDGSAFVTFDKTSLDSLLDNDILTIAIDANNNKWIGTLYGMTELNSANAFVNNFRKSNGLYNDAVQDIAIDSIGNLWLGCYTNYNKNAGISKYNGTTWVSEQITLPDTVSSNQIFRLAVDKNDNIWIALDYGIYKLTDATGIPVCCGNIVSSFKIFPNPTSDKLMVTAPAIENDQIVEIYNAIGQKIGEYVIPKGQDILTVSLKNYSEGMYFIKSGNTTKKFIVSK